MNSVLQSLPKGAYVLVYADDILLLATGVGTPEDGQAKIAGIRIILGHLPYTPADSACAEAGVLPFRYKLANSIGSRAICFLERTKNDWSEACIEIQANQILRSVAGSRQSFLRYLSDTVTKPEAGPPGK